MQFLILTKKFTVTDHKFPEPGHLFLDSDRDFTQVEKLVQKHQNIYTVDQYANILMHSQTRKRPFVTCMNGRFFKLKDLSVIGVTELSCKY